MTALSEWFTEDQTPNLRIQIHCSEVVHRSRSRYQDIAIYQTEQFGRLLALDDVIMTTEADEFPYHEMLVHPALLACPAPRRVLVVGGGDGGAAREVLRHHAVREVVVAELDEEVVAACRAHLRQTAAAFDDPRVRLSFGDGAAYVRGTRDGTFDAILVDAPDPVGCARPLFTPAFYADCRRTLAPGGVLAVQSDSPFVMPEVARTIRGALADLFPVVRTCWSVVPTYAGSLWTFTLGSLGADPAVRPNGSRLGDLAACAYWSPALHAAAFVLPAFAQARLGVGAVGTAAGVKRDPAARGSGAMTAASTVTPLAGGGSARD